MHHQFLILFVHHIKNNMAEVLSHRMKLRLERRVQRKQRYERKNEIEAMQVGKPGVWNPHYCMKNRISLGGDVTQEHFAILELQMKIKQIEIEVFCLNLDEGVNDEHKKEEEEEEEGAAINCTELDPLLKKVNK